jgi:hypothetical protein
MLASIFPRFTNPKPTIHFHNFNRFLPLVGGERILCPTFLANILHILIICLSWLHQVRKYVTLLQHSLFLWVLALRFALPILLSNNVHLDPIHALHEFSLENWLALLLSAVILRGTVDASGDRCTIHFKGLGAVYENEKTVGAACESDRDVWDYLKVGMRRWEVDGNAV